MLNITEWWKTFHVMEMADLFLDRKNPEQLQASVDFLRKKLLLNSGDRVFDQCCGVGTLSFELAKAGVVAVGADLCQAYIERANQIATQTGLSCQFVCEDAFSYVPTTSCHAAFNWYSSYGYASTDAQNEEMLHRAYEALEPGGMYALDVPNYPGVLRNFQYHLVRTGQSDGKEVTCVRESQVDWGSGQLKQVWKWFVEGAPVDTRHSALRLYWPHQIREALLRVGFVDIEMFGEVDCRALDLDSPRLILVARKS